MKDKVFGEMQFEVGWCKTEAISLWGNLYTFKIRTSTTKDDVPSEKQQQAYLSFKKNLNEISKNLLALSMISFLITLMRYLVSSVNPFLRI